MVRLPVPDHPGNREGRRDNFSGRLGLRLRIHTHTRLEPISKLPTAVDRITMSNDSAQGRAVGAHPGSFSGGEYCRWTSWAQTDSDPLCARSGSADYQNSRANTHYSAKLT